MTAMEKPEVHNARVCTFDGRDYFVASFRVAGKMEVEGCPTSELAFAWLRAEACRRDLKLGPIEYRAGDPGTAVVRVRP